MRKVYIRGTGIIEKPKEKESIFSRFLYLLSLLLYPIIVLGGFVVMFFLACWSFGQWFSGTKGEKKHPDSLPTDSATTAQWTYWTEHNGLQLYQKLKGEIRFGPAYFSVKSVPMVAGLNDKTFGDWYFQHEDGLFLQEWNSTKSPNTNLLHVDPKDLQVVLVKSDLHSVNWRMTKTEDKTLQLDCDTGKEIQKYVIELERIVN